MKFKTHNALFTTLSAMILVIVALVSCESVPTEIPDDLTAPELIQRAQEASDGNRFNTALVYYQTIINRFPSDTDSVCAAEYEIAFIHYKQKKYDIAKIEFTDLLQRYNTPDEALLPPQYKILSQKIMAKITEIENKDKPAETSS